MSQRAVSRGLLLCLACFAVHVLVAGPARAQTAGGSLTFSPPTANLSVGEAMDVTVQASVPVGVPTPTGTQTLYFMYLPSGVTTNPSSVTFTFPPGSLTTTFSFQIVAAPDAYPGSGSMYVGSTPSGLGGTLSYAINGLSVAPKGVTVAPGTESGDLTATISYGDVGFQGPQQLVFSGLPPGAVSVPDPVSFFPSQMSAVVPFRVAVASDTPAGSYEVTVQTGPVPSGVNTFVLTVLKPGTLAVSVDKPVVSACPGGPPVPIVATVAPLDGYEGTPTVSFPVLPSDLEVSPVLVPVPALPPQQTVSFTVAAKAGALPGVKVVNVLASDPGGPAGVTTITVNVGAADFAPVVSPGAVTVTAGGPPVVVTASLAPGACAPASRITVTPTGLPPGVTATPASADLVGPAYAPVLFTLTAGPTAPAGNLPVAFSFTPLGGEPKSLDVPVTVVRTGRIGVAIERKTMDLCPGGPGGPNTLTISSVDGYSGTPTVTFGLLPKGLSISPTSIAVPALPPSQVVSFTVTAGTAMPPGPVSVTAEVTDPRGISTSVPFTVNVLAPSFTPIVPPGVATLNAGGAAVKVAVMLAPDACGPTANVTVTPTGLPPGVTATPASALLEPPAFVAVEFSFQAASSAASGPFSATFTFTPETGTAKSANVGFTVCGPPAAPVSPLVKARGNPNGPVTATDFLDLSWSAPASGFAPTRYEWRINGSAWTSAAGTAASAPPRGALDPVQLFVRAYACTPEKGPGAEASSPVYPLAAPVASFSVPSSVVAGRPATFTDTSSPQATSWLWFPGDGMSATTVQSPTVTFPSAGPKVVVLVATNGSGSSTKSATVNVLPASSAPAAASAAVRSLAREADGRLALEPVEVTAGTTLLLRRLSGEGDAVAFLRLVDGDGRVVVERRLVLAEGEESRHDLAAWGATGTFRVELVGPEGLDAAVEETPLRLGGPETPVTPRRGGSR